MEKAESLRFAFGVGVVWMVDCCRSCAMGGRLAVSIFWLVGFLEEKA